MYLAEKINKKFESYGLQEHLNTIITCNQLRRFLGGVVNSFGARIIIIRDTNLIGKKYNIKISGEFDYYRKKNPITIFLHFSPKRKNIRITKKCLNRIIFLTAQTLQHELNHKDQESKRTNFVPKPIKIHYSNRLSAERIEDIHYYSEIDEIDSYGHDIAMELKYYYPEICIKEGFKNIDSLRNLHSYRQYKKAFKGLDWSKLRQSLLKKIWKWYPKIISPPKII